ncbi:cytochrome C family protein [Geoanaerobacter pelophilus]|uniref:Cytochrome C family protein n=1 Tax=Geoanaerobacter pelophilus TaxID=60036 RepID=A0ABQ0MEH5_9BACT|nr:cytochrome c3 family protein [Geoanaerobacter pelophilus]GAW65324.1 cytochrome C family protein [Geoanaerobacter pelophilus]
MAGKSYKNSALVKLAISIFISSLALSGAQVASAGYSVNGTIMKSKGPCEFSLQLQKSVEVRRSYLVELAKVLERDTGTGSDVEEMYQNIEPASFQEDSGLTSLFGGKEETLQFSRTDAISTGCLSCHDEASEVPISLNVRNDPMGGRLHRRSGGTDHPIGMDYQSYVSANPRKYRPVFTGMSDKMVFVDGKVGCLTCHDPLNPEREHLAKDDRNSRLCLTCHIM